tara:strand:- start:445 stop:924 length:480 start_codon:yes stop_codon:yes gene_type:complete
MWVVANINQYYTFRNSVNELYQDETKIYFPKINHEKNKNRKFQNLLGNYIFCFNGNFNLQKIKHLKYLKGLNYFLENSIVNQDEIKRFIKFCKSFEDKNGVLTSSFFLDVKSSNYKFINGPLKSIFFKILEIKKNKIFAETMNKKIILKKKNNIYFLSN